MAKITAPFTNGQVDKLHEWQSGMVKVDLPGGGMITQPTHPFTCCSHNDCNRLEQPNEGALIPTSDGWVCPCGAYKQDWCHDFMVGEQIESLSEIPGKSLTKYIIDLLKLAKEKGFPFYEELEIMVSAPFWRKKETILCAIVCSAIQSWLRERHKFEAWVEPVVPGRYKGFFQFYGLSGTTATVDADIDSNYELQLIGAIDHALNALLTPDGTTTA